MFFFLLECMNCTKLTDMTERLNIVEAKVSTFFKKPFGWLRILPTFGLHLPDFIDLSCRKISYPTFLEHPPDSNLKQQSPIFQL